MVAPSQIAGLDAFQIHAATYSVIPACPRLALVTVALAAATILLLCHLCFPVSSSIEELSTMSAPVFFTSFVCCHCHDSGQAHIATTCFGTRRAVELHVSRSRKCKAASKGVWSVPVEYRLYYRVSRRAEDQEAGPVGAPGQWPLRPAGGGAAAGEISALISENARYQYILIL